MNFLLSMPVWLVVLVISFFVNLLTVLFYKFFTNQEKLRSLKEETKQLQEKLKKIQQEIRAGKKVNTKELASMQSEMLAKNLEYSQHTMHVSLLTLLPVMFIFGFMNAHYLYQPIHPGDYFNVSLYLKQDIDHDKIVVEYPFNYSFLGKSIKGRYYVNRFQFYAEKFGKYDLIFQIENKTYHKDVLITNNYDYAKKIKKFNDNLVSSIEIEYRKLTPLGDFSILGWKPGWLGLYIIFSLIFSTVLRKLLNVY